MEVTIRYTPENNGKAERVNRTLIEKGRSMLAEYRTDKELWGESIYAATYILNRLHTTEGKIPAEIWFNVKPEYNKIRVFGCAAYIHIPKELREGKFAEKSFKCKMIGYCNNGYRVWDEVNRKIIKSRDVIFKKDELNIENNEELLKNTEEENRFNKEVENSEEDNEDKDKRKTKSPFWHRDYEFFTDFCSSALSTEMETIPQSRAEARLDKNSSKWDEAVEQELESHRLHDTWTRVKRQKNMKVIDSRWIFKIKKNEKGNEEKFKARLVAKGYQTTEFTETYSPVGKLGTLRTLLVVANQENLEISQMDVKTAFLHGRLKEEVYMNLPEDLYDKNYVCKLNKSIYGLRQAPKCWNEEFHKYMIELNFVSSSFDMFIYKIGR